MEGSNTKLEIRRRADSLFCQLIWDALKFCQSVSEASTKENIIKYFKKLPNLEADEIEEQINFMTSDKLLIKKSHVQSEGSNSGKEHVIYCTPVSILYKIPYYCIFFLHASINMPHMLFYFSDCRCYGAQAKARLVLLYLP